MTTTTSWLRKAVVAFLGAMMALTLSLAYAAPAAHASSDTGGGGGIGDSQYSNRITGFHTAYSRGWQNFYSQSNLGSALGRRFSQLATSTSNLYEQCKKSSAIWWVRGTFKKTGGQVWVWNAHGIKKLGGGGINNPQAKFGGSPTADNLIAGNYVLDHHKSGGKTLRSIYNNPGGKKRPALTILCSYAGEQDYKTVETRNVRTGQSNFELTKPYSYTTSVVPMKIEGEYIGGGKYTPIPPKTVKTEFAKVYDELNTPSHTDDSKYSPERIKSMVNSAVAKDEKTDFSTTVDLDSGNREAFARGGVLNVSEHTRYATISGSKYTYKQQKRECTYQRDANGRQKNYKCGSWQDVGRPWYRYGINKQLASQFQSGFWQQISVHCNKAALRQLLSKVGGTVISETDGNGNVGMVAHSKYYTGSAGRPAQPAVLDFGQPGTPSGKIGFYDKECSFQCESEDNVYEGMTPDQIRDRNTTGLGHGARIEGIDGPNGTQDGDFFGNQFTIFRDNEPREVEVNKAKPKQTADVGPAGRAVTTTVVRWKDGTPDVHTKDGGKFTVRAGGKALFTGGDKSGSLPTQKNWDTTPFSSSTVEILPGEHTKFDMQGSWASEDNRPNILNFKWEYEPVVQSGMFAKVGTSRVGSTNKGAKMTSSVRSGTPVQGKCYAGLVGGTPEMVDAFARYTGTGSVNELDADLITGTGLPTPYEYPSNLVIKFVRSAAE